MDNVVLSSATVGSLVTRQPPFHGHLYGIELDQLHAKGELGSPNTFCILSLRTCSRATLLYACTLLNLLQVVFLSTKEVHGENDAQRFLLALCSCLCDRITIVSLGP